ncbi:MAG: hypothetical protein ACI8X5_002874 [Planctomycetota bacterium]|jgi:hypothetical protein
MFRASSSYNVTLTLSCLALLSCLSFGRNGIEDEEFDVSEAVAVATQALVEMQEGKDNSEWPYEGVYRVGPYEESDEPGSQIPIGYRVGGTSIAASALVASPGYDTDTKRQEAVARAATFVAGSIKHPLMDPDYESGYDVRGWGYIYALDFMLLLERREIVPKDLKTKVRKAIIYYLNGLEQIEIPESGGWNYGRETPLTSNSATSPFMTGPALQALFAAKKQGYKVKSKLVERGMDGLERSRVDSGEVLYRSISGRDSKGGMLPGSVGRMLVTENTLLLGGRGSLSRVRGALDSFLVHWEWLDKRRAQNGTHIAPYGVAPYYFYYAHFQAAVAIELLPEAERAEYRRRLNQRLFSVRLSNGTWNDRVFDRTANYGTSIVLRALTMSEGGEPARW